ncbi:MAG: MerR family transcriptional regulator [Bordetella sp.]|uniref:MerR family transcriptional regulator n=1 Tax=Bordetella sp. TaxID=28081 RepID=UPI003F7CBB97
MSTDAALIPIREAAQRLGATARTLKYYEELGLVTPARTEGRYRLYSEADLEKFERIMRMRSLGFSLHGIAEMLKRPVELSSTGRKMYSQTSLRQMADALSEQIAQLDARIAQVQRELSEARALRAEIGDDLHYLEQRAAGAPVEDMAGQRLAARQRRAAHKTGKK